MKINVLYQNTTNFSFAIAARSHDDPGVGTYWWNTTHNESITGPNVRIKMTDRPTHVTTYITPPIIPSSCDMNFIFMCAFVYKPT